MAQQVKTINSEALEAAYRSLTPAQDGFTEDLMASNTIIPILDLTADAGGGSSPEYLQTALAFGSQTAFNVQNTTTVIANTAGFYRVFGVSSTNNKSTDGTNSFSMSDGLSSKTIWSHSLEAAASTDAVDNTSIEFDFTVFLRSGDSLSAISDKNYGIISGSTRQVADVNGVLVNPVGFTPQ